LRGRKPSAIIHPHNFVYTRTLSEITIYPFLKNLVAVIFMNSNNRKVIILNGWTKGDISDIPEFLPDSLKNWMGWSKTELEKLGYVVINPFLKDGYKQEYEDWKSQIEKIDIDENTTLVGWSAGGTFWVRWLGETKKIVHKLILVAPAKLYKKGNEESNFDRFMNFSIDPSIKERVKNIVIFISNDSDDLVKSAHLYKDTLEADLIELSNQGHFTNAERSSPVFKELIAKVTEE